MSDDLTERLRDRRVCSPAQNSCRNDYICDLAADRIEELEAKLVKAVWALKPFKILAKHHAADAPEWGPFDSVSAQVSIMYLRDAMTTLAELTGGNDE